MNLDAKTLTIWMISLAFFLRRRGEALLDHCDPIQLIPWPEKVTAASAVLHSDLFL